MDAHREALGDCDTGRETIRFTPSKPLPDVPTMLVRERMAETDRKGKR
ncbi:MAG TPA: hypothetical protein VF494_11630 [Candidatus Limnocylindrales bacterium]